MRPGPAYFSLLLSGHTSPSYYLARIGAIGAFRLGVITFLLIFTSMPALGSLRQGDTRGASRNQTRAAQTRCDLQLGSQRNTTAVEARLGIGGGCERGPRREANGTSRPGDGAASAGVGNGDDAASESLFWGGLTCVSLARGLGGTMAFTATSVLLNELLTVLRPKRPTSHLTTNDRIAL